MASEITNIAGIGSTTASVLSQHKFSTVASVANSTVEALCAVPGFSAARAEKTISAARELLDAATADSANDAGYLGDSHGKAKKDKKAKKAKGKKKDKNRAKGKKDKKHKKAKKNKKKADGKKMKKAKNK